MSRSANFILLYGMALMLLISPWAGLVVAPTLVLICIFPLLIFVQKKHWNELQFRDSPLAQTMLLGVIWIGISGFWSIKTEATFVLLVKILAMATLGFVILQYVSLMDSKQRNSFANVFVVSYIIAVLLLLEEGWTQGFLGPYVRKFIGGTFQMHDLNRSACMLVILFWPFLQALRLCVKKLSIFQLLAPCVWLLLGAALSQQLSDSALTGYVVASIIYLSAFLLKKRLSYVLQSMLVGGVLFNVFIFTILDAEEVATRFPSLPNSAVHRLFIWEFSSKISLNNIILGHGANVSRYVEGADSIIQSDEIEVADHWVNLPLHPHNSVVHIWLELGLVGVCLFTLLLRQIVVRIYDRNKNYETACCVSSLAGYVVIGLIGFGVWQPWWISTAIIAIICFSATKPSVSQ